jgi:hypothetical protein
VSVQPHPTSIGSGLKAAGETDQVVGSDGIRDATTNVQHRIVLIGRWLGRDAKLRVVLAEAVDPVALFIGSFHSS